MHAGSPLTRFRIAGIGALLAEPSRVAMLYALMDGSARPAGELARAAGVASATASAHLGRLVEGGLLAVLAQGRHRYYRIADEHVASLLETLAVARPPAARAPGPRIAPELARARTCYHHLAGGLGVALFERLGERGAWTIGGDAVHLSDAGRETLRAIGLVGADAVPPPDLAGRICVDWSVRRYHLGGRLGVWLARRAIDADWLRRRSDSRALRVTSAGRAGLRRLGIAWETLADGRDAAPHATGAG